MDWDYRLGPAWDYGVGPACISGARAPLVQAREVGCVIQVDELRRHVQPPPDS